MILSVLELDVNVDPIFLNLTADLDPISLGLILLYV